MSDQTTVLIGATGLIGSWVDQLSFPRPLIRLQRRVAERTSLPGQQTKVVNPERWPRAIAAMAPDILICCIGTTMRKAQGHADIFRNTDQHLVLACAHAARQAGARHMIVVTSIGASSRVDNVYLNAKGKVEEGLTELGFPRLDILRPGLLIGPRSEVRPMEAVGQRLAPLIDPLLRGGLRKYRSIRAESVARAIWTLADSGGEGRYIHEHDAIMALAG